MKVTIDGIIGSARKINNQRQLEEENLNKKKNEVKTDSISISRKVNSRLEKIESELREIQSTVTKNQVAGFGVNMLKEDLASGGRNSQNIIKEVKYDGDNLLKGMVGENYTNTELDALYGNINKKIDSEVTRLKHLEVEVDNIMASNLAGTDRLDNIKTNMDSIFAGAEKGNLENLSDLKVDSVMRLIK